MQAPVNTPVIVKKAKELMVTEMIVVNGVTCQIISSMPIVGEAPFVFLAVIAEGLREWESVLISIPAEQDVTVAMPACSPAAIEEVARVQEVIAAQEAQAAAPVEQEAKSKPVGPVQYMETNSGPWGYL